MWRINHPSIEDRLFGRVRVVGQCWEFQGSLRENGYGQVSYKGRPQKAHRVAWELATGLSPPRGLDVRHSCDNRRCVLPGHLFIGTRIQNMQECSDRGRLARGETNGHCRLTEEDVVDIRTLFAFGARQQDLAQAFGITQSSISHMVARRTWKHIP
jgi:hypothetical protein